jgi:hypothetical protein
MSSIKFETIPGWGLLRDHPEHQTAAKRWLKNAQQAAAHEKGVAKARWSWVDSDVVDGELRGQITAYCATLMDGRVILGVAPSLRSAQNRTRRLFRHGHCQAAGVSKD